MGNIVGLGSPKPIDLALDIGSDEIYVCKNSIITNWNIEVNTDFNHVTCFDGTASAIPMRTSFEVNLRLIPQQIIQQEMNLMQVRDKQISDCTIQELLFAVRQKVKEG